MNLALAILRRDLLALPRRRRFHLKRMGFVGAAGLILVWGFVVGNVTDSTTIGLQMFQGLSWTVLGMVYLVAVLTSGLSVIREKNERTWGLLMLTDMSPLTHILGRFVAGSTMVLLTLLSAFPAFVLVAALGGVSADQIGAAFVVMLGALVVGCSIGVFCATLVRSERQFFSLAVIVTAVVHFGLPGTVAGVVGLLRHCAAQDAETDAVSAISVMMHVSQGQAIHAAAVWNLVLSLLLGAVFLSLTVCLMPTATFREDETSAAERGRTRQRYKLLFAKPPLTGNPVAWKDECLVYGGMRLAWMACGGAAAILGAVFAVAVLSPRVRMNDAGVIILAVGAFVFFLGAAIQAFLRAAKAFNTEKEHGTMDLLLISALDDEEIIAGKAKAILRPALPWLLVSVTCGAIVVRWVGDIMAAAMIMSYFGGPVCIAAVWAFYLSLRHRVATAIWLSMLYAFLWTWLVRGVLVLPGFAIAAAFYDLSNTRRGELSAGALLAMLLIGIFWVLPDVIMIWHVARRIRVKFRRHAVMET